MLKDYTVTNGTTIWVVRNSNTALNAILLISRKKGIPREDLSAHEIAEWSKFHVSKKAVKQ